MLTFQNSLVFSKGQESEASLRNFWEPEDGFIWSTGKWCELTFAFDLGTRQLSSAADLIFDIDVFKVDEKLIGQNLYFYFNGLRVGSAFCSKRTTYVFAIDTKYLNKSENIITIDTFESACPSDFQMPDTRSLGLQLFSLQIRKIG